MATGRIKRPAYQWHVGDARGDGIYLQMTYEQRGVYRELLDQQWLDGGIPSEPQALAAMLRMSPRRFEKVWPLISVKFREQSPGVLINDRLESYRREVEAFCEKQAEKGRLGGRPRNLRVSRGLAKSKPNESTVTVTVTKNSTPEKTEPSPEAPKAPAPTKVFLDWFQAEYQKRRAGARYFVRWDAHGGIVKRLLAVHELDRLKKLAVILLTTNEPWTQGTDRGIEILSAKVNWLEDRLSQAEKARA